MKSDEVEFAKSDEVEEVKILFFIIFRFGISEDNEKEELYELEIIGSL